MDMWTNYKKYVIYFLLIISIANQSCVNENKDCVYSTQSSKPFSKNIFKLDNKFCFSDPRDSTKIFIKDDSLIFIISTDTIYYKKTILGQPKKFKIIEASNYEGGNFNYCSNFNYDLKIIDDKMNINIHFPKEMTGSYSIKLDNKRLNLILQTLKSIENNENLGFDIDNSVNFDTSKILLFVDEKYKLGVITDKDISMFYDLVKYTLREYLQKNSINRTNAFDIRTSKYFFGIRNVPKQRS